jgi:hypothetical protein
MDSSDAELEITRDDKGRVTKVAFKVNVKDDRGINRAVIAEMAAIVFASEGPEDHSTEV